VITTKIKVKPHLAEYLYGKYNNCDSRCPINLPESDDLYHLMWQLMKKRPKNATPVDEGNLCLNLEEKHKGKDPSVYNFLDAGSAQIIESKIEALFFLELHQRTDENRRDGFPITTQQVVYMMLCEYGIESITEDALIKNDYRWQAKVRRNKRRRGYNRNS